MIGNQELILIVIVALLLFGSTKLPELARSLGSSMKEFKKGQMESDLPSGPDKDSKIIKLAIEMGIDIRDKNPDQLIEEIRSRITGRK